VRSRGEGQHNRGNPAPKLRVLKDYRIVRPSALGRATMKGTDRVMGVQTSNGRISSGAAGAWEGCGSGRALAAYRARAAAIGGDGLFANRGRFDLFAHQTRSDRETSDKLLKRPGLVGSAALALLIVVVIFSIRRGN
jgi:hypothetical protein